MYNFTEIEKKWQNYWKENNTFKVNIWDFSKPKFCLEVCKNYFSKFILQNLNFTSESGKTEKLFQINPKLSMRPAKFTEMGTNKLKEKQC